MRATVLSLASDSLRVTGLGHVEQVDHQIPHGDPTLVHVAVRGPDDLRVRANGEASGDDLAVAGADRSGFRLNEKTEG